MEVQQEIRREWHAQPVSMVVHLITLIGMIAGFGVVIGIMQERQDSSTRVQEVLQTQQLQTFQKDATQDGRLSVLENQFGTIDKKLDLVISEVRELNRLPRK